MNRVKFTTTVDSVLLEKMKIIAIKEKRNISDILNDFFTEYVEKYKE